MYTSSNVMTASPDMHNGQRIALKRAAREAEDSTAAATEAAASAQQRMAEREEQLQAAKYKWVPSSCRPCVASAAWRELNIGTPDGSYTTA
eukprot:scaffold310762_cov31-Prasinocladus_malaysianus.AAC.1